MDYARSRSWFPCASFQPCRLPNHQASTHPGGASEDCETVRTITIRVVYRLVADPFPLLEPQPTMIEAPSPRMRNGTLSDRAWWPTSPYSAKGWVELYRASSYGRLGAAQAVGTLDTQEKSVAARRPVLAQLSMVAGVQDDRRLLDMGSKHSTYCGHAWGLYQFLTLRGHRHAHCLTAVVKLCEDPLSLLDQPHWIGRAWVLFSTDRYKPHKK